MVSKVVINSLMQPANWAVRNSRVSYAHILVVSCSQTLSDEGGRVWLCETNILVGKLSVLPDFAETLHHEALAELAADHSNSRLLKCIKHPHIKDYFCFSLRGARVRYNTDLTVVTSCCVHDCTNCVKNGSFRTNARCFEYLSFGCGSRDAI